MRFAGVVLAVGFVLALAACGGDAGVSHGIDAANGKRIFTEKCQSCHTLADAGSQSRWGPNLDDAFAFARAQGFEESTIEQVVREQISIPGIAGGGNEPGAVELVAELGCGTCHSFDGSRGIGPSLLDVTSRLDDEQVIESLRDPDAEIAPGFQPGIMSGAIPPGTISQEHAKALLDYLRTNSPAMPADLVTGKDADDVAAYVASVAGTGGGGGGGGGPEAEGQALFASLACNACHALDGSKGVGPPLDGIASERGDDSVLQSILDPDAEIVPGYQAGVMSAAVPPGSVSQQQAEALLAYLKTVG